MDNNYTQVGLIYFEQITFIHSLMSLLCLTDSLSKVYIILTLHYNSYHPLYTILFIGNLSLSNNPIW